MAHSPSLFLQILFLITTPTFDAAPPPTVPATPDVLRQQQAAEDYPTHPPKLDASLPFHWQPTATASATGSLYNKDPRAYLLGRDTIRMAHSPSLFLQILFLITTPTFDAAPPPTVPATPDVLRQQQAAEDYPTHPPKLDASLPFHWQPTATASATGSLYNKDPRAYLLGRDTIGMAHSPSLFLQILFLITTPTFDAAPPPTVPATPDVLRQQQAAEDYPTHPPKLDASLPFHWQPTATASLTGSLYNEDPRAYLLGRDTIGMAHSPSLYLQILFQITTATFDAAPPPTVPATPDVLRQQQAAEDYPTHPPKLDASLPFHWQPTATASATGSLYNKDPRAYLLGRDTIRMAHSPSLYLQLLVSGYFGVKDLRATLQAPPDFGDIGDDVILQDPEKISVCPDITYTVDHPASGIL
ncbi:hypothetical protein ISCGN_032389 [Ixodes scapularis]